jgi:hypothetical protein
MITLTVKLMNGEMIEVALEHPTVKELKKAIAEDSKTEDENVTLFGSEGELTDDNAILEPEVIYNVFISLTNPLKNTIKKIYYHFAGKPGQDNQLWNTLFWSTFDNVEGAKRLITSLYQAIERGESLLDLSERQIESIESYNEIVDETHDYLKAQIHGYVEKEFPGFRESEDIHPCQCMIDYIQKQHDKYEEMYYSAHELSEGFIRDQLDKWAELRHCKSDGNRFDHDHL